MDVSIQFVGNVWMLSACSSFFFMCIAIIISHNGKVCCIGFHTVCQTKRKMKIWWLAGVWDWCNFNCFQTNDHQVLWMWMHLPFHPDRKFRFTSVVFLLNANSNISRLFDIGVQCSLENLTCRIKVSRKNSSTHTYVLNSTRFILLFFLIYVVFVCVIFSSSFVSF